MGFRVRKSISIAPGIRLNVTKTGIGATAGGRGARYSVHSSGRKTVSARTGIPGTYYQKTLRGSSRDPAARQPPPRPAQPSPVKLGLFAPKGEKQLYNAIKQQDVQAMRHAGDEHPAFRLAAYSLTGLLLVTKDL
jgi:uncharacterized protein RhaS with RHS repeats